MKLCVLWHILIYNFFFDIWCFFIRYRMKKLCHKTHNYCSTILAFETVGCVCAWVCVCNTVFVCVCVCVCVCTHTHTDSLSLSLSLSLRRTCDGQHERNRHGGNSLRASRTPLRSTLQSTSFFSSFTSCCPSTWYPKQFSGHSWGTWINIAMNIVVNMCIISCNTWYVLTRV